MGERAGLHYVDSTKHTQRYHKNHLIIIGTVCSLLCANERITLTKVAQITGLSRQTIYNHFSSIDVVMPSGAEYLQNQYRTELNIMENIDKKYDSMPEKDRLFYEQMKFMSKYKDLFSKICSDINSQVIIYKLSSITFNQLHLDWSPSGIAPPREDSGRITRTIRCIVDIISRWAAQDGCAMLDSYKYRKCIRKYIDMAENNRMPLITA